MCALFSRFNNSSISTSCLFFSFFFVRHFGPIIKKKVFRLLVLIKSDDFCRHFYFYSPLFFPWEEEDEGRFIIIFGRLSCVSIVTRARLERTKEEEALTHLSTERERERERGATDDHHHRDCFCGALCVLLFFGGGSSILVVVVDSFAAAKGVALTTRLDRRRQSRPSFRARARTRFERKKDTPSPPAVASLRETGDRRIAS